MPKRTLVRAALVSLALGAAPAAALPPAPDWLVPFPITRRMWADHSAADDIDVFVRLDAMERGRATVGWEASRPSLRAEHTFATLAGALALALPQDCREVPLSTVASTAAGSTPVLSPLERGRRVRIALGPDASGAAAAFFAAPGEGARCRVLVHAAPDPATGGILLEAASADGAALARQPIAFGPERFHRWAIALLLITVPADLALLAAEVGVLAFFVLLFTAPARLMS